MYEQWMNSEMLCQTVLLKEMTYLNTGIVKYSNGTNWDLSLEDLAKCLPAH